MHGRPTAELPGRAQRYRGEARWTGKHPAANLVVLSCAHDSLTPNGPAVNRTNVLYLIIGALTIAVVAMGYQLYQDRHQPEGLHINVGPGGLSIQGK